MEGKLCSIMETIVEQGDTLEILSTHHKKEHAHNKGKAIKESSVKLSTEDLSEVDVFQENKKGSLEVLGQKRGVNLHHMKV
ncbi:hypothetical protein Bca4012_063283 [Brassica carinata]